MKSWDPRPQGAFQSRTWKKPITVVVMPDRHIPYHDWRAIEVAEKILADLKVDLYIDLGDFLDFAAVSRWVADAPGETANEALWRDLRDARKHWERARQIVGKDAQMVWLYGNHEFRLSRFGNDVHPYFKGMFSLANLLDLDDIGVQTIDSHGARKMLRVDWQEDSERKAVLRSRELGRLDWHAGLGTAFIHGWYAGRNALKRHVEDYGHGASVFCGHLHWIGVYDPRSFGWPKKFAASVGCLRQCDPSYFPGADGWGLGFGVVHIDPSTPGGVEFQQIRIQPQPDGARTASFRGKRYASRRLCVQS